MRQLLILIFIFVTYLLTGQGIVNPNVAANDEDMTYIVAANANSFTGSNPYSGTLSTTTPVAVSNQYTNYPSFIITNITTGDILVSSLGALYEVLSATPSGADMSVTVQKITTNPGGTISVAPSGVVNIVRPTSNCGLIPMYAVNNNGIDPIMQSVVDNYNKNRLDNCIGTISIQPDSAQNSYALNAYGGDNTDQAYMDSLKSTIDALLLTGGADGAITNLVLDNDTLKATGSITAFNGNIDLSSVGSFGIRDATGNNASVPMKDTINFLSSQSGIFDITVSDGSPYNFVFTNLKAPTFNDAVLKYDAGAWVHDTLSAGDIIYTPGIHTGKTTVKEVLESLTVSGVDNDSITSFTESGDTLIITLVSGTQYKLEVLDTASNSYALNAYGGTNTDQAYMDSLKTTIDALAFAGGADGAITNITTTGNNDVVFTGSITAFNGTLDLPDTVVVSNGLTMATGKDIELGGILERNTDINTDVYEMTFTNTAGDLTLGLSNTNGSPTSDNSIYFTNGQDYFDFDHEGNLNYNLDGTSRDITIGANNVTGFNIQETESNGVINSMSLNSIGSILQSTTADGINQRFWIAPSNKEIMMRGQINSTEVSITLDNGTLSNKDVIKLEAQGDTTAIQFIAGTAGQGTAGDVWTNQGSGLGEWAAPSTTSYQWYYGGKDMRVYATFDPFVSNYTENSVGDYSFNVPSGEDLDRIEWIINTTGGNLNVTGSSNTTIRVVSATGNTNNLNTSTPHIFLKSVTVGHVAAAGNPALGGFTSSVSFSAGTAIIVLTNLGAENTAKVSITNLSQK